MTRAQPLHRHATYLLQIRMKFTHLFLRLWVVKRQAHDQRVKDEKRSLFERAAADLRRVDNWDGQRAIRYLRQMTTRVAGDGQDVSTFVLGNVCVAKAHRSGSGSGDDHDPVAVADGGRGHLADQVDLHPEVHK